MLTSYEIWIQNLEAQLSLRCIGLVDLPDLGIHLPAAYWQGLTIGDVVAMALARLTADDLSAPPGIERAERNADGSLAY